MTETGKNVYQYGDNKLRRKKLNEEENEYDNSLAKKVFGNVGEEKIMRKADDKTNFDFAFQGLVGNTAFHPVIITPAFQESVVYQVYAALLSNSIFQKYSSIFKIDDDHNLTFDYSIMPSGFGRQADTHSDADDPDAKITINGNSNNYQQSTSSVGTYTKKPADIFIAKTLIHELMHAYIGAMDIDISKEEGANSAIREHQYMALYMRDDLVKGLQEFAEQNYIDIPLGEIQAISWQGLNSTTPAYDRIPEFVKGYYDTVTDKYSSQIKWISPTGTIVRDDMAKYGGNLPTAEMRNTMRQTGK